MSFLEFLEHSRSAVNSESLAIYRSIVNASHKRGECLHKA